MTASQDRAREDIWGQVQRQRDLDATGPAGRTRQQQIEYMRAKTNHELARRRWLADLRATGDAQAAADCYRHARHDSKEIGDEQR